MSTFALPIEPPRPRAYEPLSKRTAPSAGAKPATAHRSAAGDGSVIYDAELVIYRLEEAGAALLALPSTGHTTKLRTSSLDIVRNAVENYGYADKRIRPAVPSAATITRMDEAMAWITLIPADNYMLRRIVGARSLVSPMTERHLFTWRRLAAVLGADHKSVQRWHGQGIGTIVSALNRR